MTQGCAATLGKQTPDPINAEGVAPILGGEDNTIQNRVGLMSGAFFDVVMTEHLWRSIRIYDLRFPG